MVKRGNAALQREEPIGSRWCTHGVRHQADVRFVE